MSPNATSFITPALPTAPRSSSSRNHHKSSRRVKATASPPPPPPPGKGGSSSGGDSTDAKRAALEKALAKKMEPASGRTGQRECIWCGGAKMRRCSWCDGKGIRHETVSKSWDELAADAQAIKEGGQMELPKRLPVTCSACSGSCKLRCAYCRGSGVGSYGHAY